MHNLGDLQGRPSAALTSRHMLKIQYDKTMSVGFLARQSDTIPPSTASNIGIVNTNVSCSIFLADQALI
jgi:hypothetical protein